MCTIHQHHLVEEKMINLKMAVHLQQMHRKQCIKEEHQMIKKVAVVGNLTSGWLREMEALSKTNMLRREFKVRGEPGQRDKIS